MSVKYNIKRLVLGLLVAPLMPSLIVLFLSLMGNVSDGLWLLKLIAMIEYLTMIVIGLPIHLLFQRNGWKSVWLYLIVGILLGAGTATFIFLPQYIIGAGQANTASFAIAGIAALYGAITAVTFWLIVRPDITAIRGHSKLN